MATSKKTRRRILLAPDEMIIWRPYRTNARGRRVYASAYGLRAWPIVVKKK